MTIAHYTTRVGARASLARTLQKTEYADRCKHAGLLANDLAIIQSKGEEAETADRKQHEEIAQQRHDIAESLKARGGYDQECDRLRNRIPAVAEELASNPKTADQAGWLRQVAFDRFRIRLVTPQLPDKSTPEPTSPNAQAQPSPARERVARSDRLSRAQSMQQFAAALLADERLTIVKALDKRGFGPDRLQALRDAAQNLVARLGGTEALRASDWTQQEAEAVIAQKQRWDSCRRMIREAVQGEPSLEKLVAAC